MNFLSRFTNLDGNAMLRREMIRIYLACLLVFPISAVADIVLVPRSELFGYMMGQQAGKAVGHIMDLQAYSANRMAGYAAIDAWRKELAVCGECANRNNLVAKIEEMQQFLFKADVPFCATVDIVESNPQVFGRGMDAVGRITGTGQVCERFKREVEIIELKEETRQAKQQFDRKLKAGDISAYSEMGHWISNRYLTGRAVAPEERLYFSCHYFSTGARKGDLRSLFSWARACWLTKEEYQEVARLLHACVQTGRKVDARCAEELDFVAFQYSSSRLNTRQYPMAIDDREALRLREAVLRYWEKQSVDSPGDSSVAAQLQKARQKVAALKADQQPLPPASDRGEIHAYMGSWCERNRTRAGQGEFMAHNCTCFVRETDRLMNEGRLSWAKVKRDGVFDFKLVEACIDRTATADAWVAYQRGRLLATADLDGYLSCAHRAIARDMPLDQLGKRHFDGWKGTISPLCGAR